MEDAGLVITNSLDVEVVNNSVTTDLATDHAYNFVTPSSFSTALPSSRNVSRRSRNR